MGIPWSPSALRSRHLKRPVDVFRLCQFHRSVNAAKSLEGEVMKANFNLSPVAQEQRVNEEAMRFIDVEFVVRDSCVLKMILKG